MDASGLDIGLILGAFGIKGEIRVLSFNDEPERFQDLDEIIVVDPEGKESAMKIDKVRIHKNRALLKLNGVKDRTEAEALKGGYIRLTSGNLTTTEETRTERDILVGLEVYTKSGMRLGVLEEVIQTGANDVYEVIDGEKSVLLPAIRGVILEVDLDKGRMVVDPLPGLL